MATYAPLLSDDARALLTLDERRDYWAPRLGDGSTGVVVRVAEAEVDGRIVGLVSADRAGGEVPALHVEPILHGRGVGRLLLGASLEDLRAAGWTSAWLTVLTSNRAAIAFYDHLGWMVDGEPFSELMEGREELPVVELQRYRLAL